jgi:hypothetical protein
MRVTRVDLDQVQAFARRDVARARTGAEWRRALLDAGLMVDLGEPVPARPEPASGQKTVDPCPKLKGGEIGHGTDRLCPVRGVQAALAHLLATEDALLGVDQPAPWSVGGVPPAAWAIIAVTWVLLTGVWNALVGFFGGAVLLGVVAMVGLVRHRQEVRVIEGRVRDARQAVMDAGSSLTARTLALDRAQFPIETEGVRVEAV